MKDTNLRTRAAQLRALELLENKLWDGMVDCAQAYDEALPTEVAVIMDRAKLTTITVYVRLTDAENKSVEDIAEFVFDLRRALTPAKKKRKAK